MSLNNPESQERVGWARRVNARWITHHGLQQSAQTFLDHLESADPARLLLSCSRAFQMVHQCTAGEDPKPWFYAGLFSLATSEEVQQFLKDHWFTAACVPSLGAELTAGLAVEGIREDTQSKLDHIREALIKLPPAD